MRVFHRLRRGTAVGALLVLVGALGGACGDGPTDSLTGFVRVTITGLPSGIASAGHVRITGEGISPIEKDLEGVTTDEEEVPVGTYDVVYTPPDGYTIADGAPNAIDVTITANDTTTVTFNLEPATATIRVAVTGLPAGGTDGGSASIQRTDVGGQAPFILPIPAAGTEHTTVQPGDYDVTYTAPEGYVVDDGVANPVSLAVAQDDTAAASFAVVEATGVLALTITGLEAGAADGGSASALRTDVGGASPIVVDIPAAGAADTVIVVGDYTVTYTPPSGYALVAGQTNPQDVAIATDDTTTIALEVEAVAPPADVVFTSDFSTALGTTSAALLDTSEPLPWTLIAGNGVLNEVISSAGLSFPTANVLRVEAGFRAGGGAAAQTHLLQDTLPIPGVGGSLYYRWYIRVVEPDAYTADLSTHPMQDGLTDQNWVNQIYNRSDGQFDMTFSTFGSANPNNRWDLVQPLPKGQTFRVEMRFHRIGTSTFNLHARVYNSADSLLFDNDDFENANGSVLLSSTPTLNVVNLNSLRDFTAGFNGLNAGAEGEFPFVLYYQGGFCIRTQDWCGPYAGGT